jgi:hypothetical protein
MANIIKDFDIRTLVHYTATSTESVTSTGLDMQGYDSALFLISYTTGTTAHALHAEMSDSTSTSDFVDIAGSEVTPTTAGTRTLGLEVFRPLKRYVRFVFDPSATVEVDAIHVIRGKAGSLPVVNDSSTNTKEFHFVASASSGTA